jgi:hypothetical protein
VLPNHPSLAKAMFALALAVIIVVAIALVQTILR